MNNKYKFTLLLLILLPTLTACQQQSQGTTNSSKNNNDKDDATSITKDSNTVSINLDETKCIGCGHCARFDSNNFAMTNSHKATVISSSADPNSTSLQRAISACPTKAITI